MSLDKFKVNHTEYVKPPGKVIPEDLRRKIESISIDEFKTDALEEIFYPLCNIVFELKDKIKNGEYSLVIGDDASGHVPALILYKFIREVYKKENHKIHIIFLAGSREINPDLLDDKKQKIEDLLKNKLNINRNQKVLMVTDIIYTGETLIPIKEILNKMNVGYNLASVSILREKDFGELQQKFDNNIVYGTHGELQTILGNYKLSGFEKEPGEIFAKKKDLTNEELEYFKVGREDVEIAVKKLVSFYESLG